MQETAARRLMAVSMHLDAVPACTPPTAAGISMRSTRATDLNEFNSHTMEVFLDDLRDMKSAVYEVFKQHPELLLPVTEGLTHTQHRAVVRDCLKVVLSEAGVNPLELFEKDLKKYIYMAELAAPVDLSLAVKMGVQYSLWGGSVVNLGTAKHRQRFFNDINSFRAPGCFAMTELKHGSNVSMLQTEAVYDHHTDEWVISTPDEGAIKWWIGNAAEDGRWATVFARLRIPRNGSGIIDDHGVHAFICAIRNDEGKLMPGVEIRDCGYKVGLNGVDNGAVAFHGVRIPRENLLDRFAQVDRSGQYTSPMPNAARRFAATLGELTGGRVGLCAASVSLLRCAVTVAVRFSLQRQQFGPPDAPEIAILDYQSQQQKLMPMLATCYGLGFAKDFLVEKYVSMKQTRDEKLVADVHSLSAGLKAYVTNYTADAISICRECCGGHGYAAVNRMGAWRSDHDIFKTFEGDNTVLLQQTAGLLLKEYKAKFSGSPVTVTYTYLRHLVRDSLPANPLTTHETDPAKLRDPAFLDRALRYRTARLLQTAALRLRKHTARLGAFHAWNKCLSHLLLLAKAHIEWVIYQQFMLAVGRCMDPDCRAALKTMADLFALSIIEHDVLYRNHELIAPSKSKAIQKLIIKLCAELRATAASSVAAFAIPDEILRSPIGTSTFVASQDAHLYDGYLQAAGFDLSELI